jgi:hypothetical protein
VTDGRVAGFTIIDNNRRFSQISYDIDDKRFRFDFWDRGVWIGHANTRSPLDVAQSLHAWMELKVTISEMRESFPFIAFESIAVAFEQDKEVEWKWDSLEDFMRNEEHIGELLPLLLVARKKRELKMLFPFTSHIRLCFSRCTGFPYSGDCPFAAPTKQGQYQVFNASGQAVGKGDAESAVQLLIDHLPPNCGPAVKGTADDL